MTSHGQPSIYEPVVLTRRSASFDSDFLDATGHAVFQSEVVHPGHLDGKTSVQGPLPPVKGVEYARPPSPVRARLATRHRVSHAERCGTVWVSHRSYVRSSPHPRLT